MVRNAVASSAKNFPFPETIACFALCEFQPVDLYECANFSQVFRRLIFSTGSEKNAWLRVTAYC